MVLEIEFLAEVGLVSSRMTCEAKNVLYSWADVSTGFLRRLLLLEKTVFSQEGHNMRCDTTTGVYLLLSPPLLSCVRHIMRGHQTLTCTAQCRT